MKQVVFFRVYSIPILLGVFLIIRLSFGMTAFKIYGDSVFLFAVMASALLTDRRYVQSFSLNDDRLHITYIDQFLIRKTHVYRLEEIKSLRLNKRTKIAAMWPPFFSVRTEEDQKDYLIISKELYQNIRNGLPDGKLELKM